MLAVCLCHIFSVGIFTSHCACLHGLVVRSCCDWIVECHGQNETRLANWRVTAFGHKAQSLVTSHTSREIAALPQKTYSFCILASFVLKHCWVKGASIRCCRMKTNSILHLDLAFVNSLQGAARNYMLLYMFAASLPRSQSLASKGRFGGMDRVGSDIVNIFCFRWVVSFFSFETKPEPIEQEKQSSKTMQQSTGSR